MQYTTFIQSGLTEIHVGCRLAAGTQAGMEGTQAGMAGTQAGMAEQARCVCASAGRTRIHSGPAGMSRPMKPEMHCVAPWLSILRMYWSLLSVNSRPWIVKDTCGRAGTCKRSNSGTQLLSHQHGGK